VKETTMPVRVLLADDQAMVRTGFRLILESEPDFEVVAEAADGEEAVRRARELRPDVVLMDIRMPLIDGIQATKLLAGPGAADPLRVVVVTTYDVDENVYAALRAGACGFLVKDAGPRCWSRRSARPPTASRSSRPRSPPACSNASPKRPRRPPPWRTR
jgi:DNA-binding NarL/FixJ family response regulator